MKEFTLSLDEQLIERAQTYATQQNTSLNGLIESLLEQILPSENSNAECSEFVRLTLENPGESRGRRWTREELYDV